MNHIQNQTLLDSIKLIYFQVIHDSEERNDEFISLEIWVIRHFYSRLIQD